MNGGICTCTQGSYRCPIHGMGEYTQPSARTKPERAAASMAKGWLCWKCGEATSEELRDVFERIAALESDWTKFHKLMLDPDFRKFFDGDVASDYNELHATIAALEAELILLRLARDEQGEALRLTAEANKALREESREMAQRLLDLEWSLITPDNLPRAGDELGGKFPYSLWFCTEVNYESKANQLSDWLERGYTYRRPINPPKEDGDG